MPPKTKRRRAAVPPPPVTPPSRLPPLLLWIGAPLVIAALMAWYALRARAAAGEFGFPLDDSWIHVRFAQNLAAGKGFSFNPGQPAGLTTSPLWTLLLAAAYRLTHEYLFTAAVLNWALCSLLCVLVYYLALTIHPSRWLALTAAAAVAVTAPLPWWALSGMEPPLYAGLALLSILLHLRLRKARGLRALLPTVAMALATLARPELLVLFPLALLDRLFVSGWIEREPRPLRAWLTRLVLHSLVFAALLAPQFLYNHVVTGYWLPTSFYSKVQPDFSQAQATGNWLILVGSAFHELFAVLLMWAHNNLLLLVPFLLGLWLIMKQLRGPDRQYVSVLLPLLVILQPMSWAFAGGYRDPTYQSQRYMAHVDVLYLVIGVYGGWWVTQRVGALRTRSRQITCVAAVLLLSLALQPEARNTYARNVKNTTDMQVALGRWLRDNTPEDALLAVNDVGAIGVLAGRPVLDLQGLVTPEALAVRAERRRQVAASPLPPTAMVSFIRSRRADYVVIFPNWYGEFRYFSQLFTPVYDVGLDDNITCGAAEMTVYRTAWARHGP